MTGAVVFTGITIGAAEGVRTPDVELCPPVGRGDVVRIVEERAPRVIGIIDGAFESAPAVLHKEMLWAMSKGVHVFGGAGYGALRAVELEAFGMVGVGEVYGRFRDGRDWGTLARLLAEDYAALGSESRRPPKPLHHFLSRFDRARARAAKLG